jgi:glyoxylase-like metal-dependent hydrolase (beta-lactamase superfamily II)
MLTHTIPSGPFATNAYIVGCDATRRAVIIDPAPGSSDAIGKILTQKELTPVAIWLTHSHWDHIADASILKKLYNIPVFVHSEDAPNLQDPGSDLLPCWITIEGIENFTPIKENDTLTVGDLTFHVIHTPGHTPGGVCFYCPEEKILFSGDTLFKGTIGNISFPTSRPKLMWPSLKKLSLLPNDTKVYPGHGPRTTIGTESWLSRAEETFGNDYDLL